MLGTILSILVPIGICVFVWLGLQIGGNKPKLTVLVLVWFILRLPEGSVNFKRGN